MLSLEHLDVDSWLVVLVGGEDLRLLGWNDGVAVDQLGHHTANSLNTQSQRSHIQEQQFLSTFTTQDTCLHSGTVSNSFIRVDTTVGLLTVEEILDKLLNLGNSCGTTDQHDLINLVLLEATV